MADPVAGSDPELRARYAECERLGKRITEYSAWLSAGEYRLLEMIREFDRGRLWWLDGLHSCAHWLNHKCGIGLNAAREKVRVANALGELPQVSERYRKGEISYSKVRAISRIATKENERYLLQIAYHGTAAHVEQLVQKYRRCRRLQDKEESVKQHTLRELSYFYDEQGCLNFRGKLPAETGALVLKALDRAIARAKVEINAECKHLRQQHGRGPWKTAIKAPVDGVIDPKTVRHLPDVSAETRDPFQSDFAYVEDGPHVSAETARRLSCDAALVAVTDDANGEPLSIGRKSRLIPPALRRALRMRDDGCRFPGCTHKRFIDGHHIRHWADGGETSLDNLVQLCRYHHRLVHEHGFGCESAARGEIRFTNLIGRELGRTAPQRITESTEARVWLQRELDDLTIDSSTIVPRMRAGEKMDWDLAVSHLFTKRRLPARAAHSSQKHA